METSSTECDYSEQETFSVEEHNHIPWKRGLHIPQFIQGKSFLIFCTILGIGWVLLIALLSQSLKNFAQRGNGNLTASVLQELTELKRENGRIAKEVTQVMGKLHDITVELMAKGNLTPSALEALSELQRETGRIAKDVIQLLEEFRNFTELSCTTCPQNWLRFEKSCYFFSTSLKAWFDAKQDCEKEGAYLLIVNSLVEHNFLVKHLGNEQVFWIGLSDTNKEGEWLWLDGSRVSLSFWGAGEPNNAGHREDCATLRFNGKWNDALCSLKEYWICKKKC
ncbi:C-type lectin domain family 17, member A-like isoform X3 [Rhineura floridana]|uniref:C-type lectin domain family 17, member A-like isoform X3 n=1 Tax=Rhineura floridana TaxID=261503 RepID=UPI002AC8859B|nr:C-type lectin domain family 17, member A-like isoform X3 [Rhineura floridana]